MKIRNTYFEIRTHDHLLQTGASSGQKIKNRNRGTFCEHEIRTRNQKTGLGQK